METKPDDTSSLTASTTADKDEVGSKKKLVICMVGLPARGKSWASKRLKHYLSSAGRKTEVFNGEARERKKCSNKVCVDLNAHVRGCFYALFTHGNFCVPACVCVCACMWWTGECGGCVGG